MGFLTGAYGKLTAGKLVRQLQVEMTHIQSQLRRATKEVGIMEKQMQAQQRCTENQIRQSTQMQSSIFQGIGYAQMASFTPDAALAQKVMQGAANEAEKAMYQSQVQAQTQSNMQIQTQMQMMNQSIQSQSQMQLSMAQDEFEMIRESMLQPLKDLEEDLQSEKDNLESRLKIAQAEYDAKKEEEKASVKSLAPDYTGQG